MTIMKTNTKIIFYLSIIALLDMVIPIPFTALLLIFVIFEKPAWFRNLQFSICTIFSTLFQQLTYPEDGSEMGQIFA
jgi:hypothetical protein